MGLSKMMEISNLDKLAIVVVGYNRLDSIKRVLKSLLDSSYPSNDIPLVISIDCGGVEELYEYVKGFAWPYGEKFVNIEKERLGLKKHIFKCCGFSKYFKGVIILEDDSFVAPYFYYYATCAIDRYGEDDLVCGISLYVSHNNEYVNIPFFPYNNGSDVFLLQDVQTRGECFTYHQWESFEKWLPNNEDRDFSEVYMPERIKTWKRAWSKYYYAYMVEVGKYFVYPYTSFVTNMGAVGEHATTVVNVVQVALEWGHKEYIFPSSQNLVRYDAFYCNEELYNRLSLPPNDLCIDYYGFNPNIPRRRYVLTYKSLPYKIIRTFGLRMYPIEVNVIMNIEGSGLFLYDTFTPATKKIKENYDFLNYVFCKQNPRLMKPFIHKWEVHRLIEGIKKRFKSVFIRKK